MCQDFSTSDQFSTGNVRMSEGTFCHVGVHMNSRKTFRHLEKLQLIEVYLILTLVNVEWAKKVVPWEFHDDL